MEVGIAGYGAYVPRHRIKVEEIAKVWGTDAPSYKRGLRLQEKSVPSPDQDTITMSVEAARHALARSGTDPGRLGAVYVGSESHPYAVKPSGTVVAEAVGATPEVHCADLEFACKAGTEGMFVALSLVQAGNVETALAIGADTSQGAPGDALEYSASAGAAAFVFAREGLVAVCEHTYAYMTDTPDFWRREYQHYPRHAGRFTGEPAYFKHVQAATRAIMERTELKPRDFRHVVFHMPNGKFPLLVGKKLGFKPEQIEAGRVVPTMGNTYSGSSPTGLAAVLDIAEPDDLILITSFGSGAASDSFVLKATKLLPERRDRAATVRSMLEGPRRYLTYGEYAKYREKIILLSE